VPSYPGLLLAGAAAVPGTLALPTTSQAWDVFLAVSLHNVVTMADWEVMQGAGNFQPQLQPQPCRKSERKGSACETPPAGLYTGDSHRTCMLGPGDALTPCNAGGKPKAAAGGGHRPQCNAARAWHYFKPASGAQSALHNKSGAANPIPAWILATIMTATQVVLLTEADVQTMPLPGCLDSPRLQ
jgi:hypothetical protein